MSSDEPKINIGSISGGNNIIGKNEGGQHNHIYGARDVGPGDVFDAVEKAVRELPEDEAESVITEIVDPLEKLANLPAEEQTEDVKEQAQSLVSKLQPYAPSITKTLVTLGEAGLSALASTNPVVSILVATLRAAKGMLTSEE